MLTEDFSRYFRRTYTNDVFRYTTAKYKDIIDWKGWNQNTEKTFKKILKRIKNEKGYQDKNPKIKSGKYLSELISGKQYMTIYYIPLESNNNTIFLIHSLKLGNCPNL